MTDGQKGFEGAGRGRRSLWRFLPLGLLLLAVLAFFATGANRYFSFDMIIEQRDRLKTYAEAHRFAALGLFMAVYVTAVLLSLPASAFLTVIGGFLFGWPLGLLAAVTSATLGATGLFLIVRTSLGEWLLRRAGSRIQKLAAGFRRNALFYILFLRLTPVVPFWVTNIAAPVCGVPLRIFVLGTPLGMLPVSVAFAFAGSGLDSVVLAQQRAREACRAAQGAECGADFSLASLVTPEMIVAFAALGLLAFIPVAVKSLYGSKVEGDDRADR